jgi:hypothetical protein
MQDGLFVEDVEQWVVIHVSVGDCKVRLEKSFMVQFYSVQTITLS